MVVGVVALLIALPLAVTVAVKAFDAVTMKPAEPTNNEESSGEPKASPPSAPHPKTRRLAGAPSKDKRSLFDRAGGSIEDLEQALGPATSCEKVKGGTECRWGDAVQIVFTKHGADWFGIAGGGFTFGPALLGQLSLPPAPPAAQNDQAIKWENVHGLLRIIAMSDGAGGVQRVYVLAKSLPPD